MEAVLNTQGEVKRGRGRPKGSHDTEYHPRPTARLYATAKELEDKIDAYFIDVESKKETYYNEKTGIPTFIKTPTYYPRLLLFLGFTFSTVEPYENGEYDDDINKYADALTRARMRCESDAVEGSAKGQYNDRIMTAVLKQWHNFTEKQDINITGTVLHQLQVSPEQAEQMLQSALDARQKRLAATVDAEVLEVKTEPIQ